MPSLYLTPAELASISSVAVVCPKEDVAPVLSYVRIRFENGRVNAVATDRYRVVRVSFAPHFFKPDEEHADEAPESFEALVRGADLTGLARQLKAAKLSPAEPIRLELVEEGAALSLSWQGGSVTMPTAQANIKVGNFPAAERLFPSDEPDATIDFLSVDLKMLADALKIVLPGDDRSAKDGFVFRFTAGRDSDKPGPIYGTRSIETGPRKPDAPLAEFMIQPRLRLR